MLRRKLRKQIQYAGLIQCVQIVTVQLQKMLEVMSVSIYTGLNLFNTFCPAAI
jgi:hypothetical protein